MTALVARSPLHPLGMNGSSQANNSRRRSARRAFEDDDDSNNNSADGGGGGQDARQPPAKKIRGSTTGVGVADGSGATAANGKSGRGQTLGSAMASSTTVPLKQAVAGGSGAAKAAAAKKAKRAYEETDDGFEFSRKGSRRTAAKAKPETSAQSAEANGAQASNAQSDSRQEGSTAIAQAEQGEAAQPARRKPRKTLPSTPERDEIDKARKPIRRSKRLSGETQEPAPNEVDPFNARPKGSPRREDARATNHSPAPSEPQTLRVGKRRETKIPLPNNYTPIIRRNQEMRKTTGEQHRRSSSGMRGKRVSSLIDSGNSNAVPHAQVNTSDFYKHISQDLTEPRRMRQLLVWCGHRALPSKPGANLKPAESQAIHAARVIQDELLADFGSKGQLSNWFDRQDTAPVSLVKRPHPTNTKNAAKLKELEAELARLQGEKRSWTDLLASNFIPSAESKQTPKLDTQHVDQSLLDPAQSAILSTLVSASASSANHRQNEAQAQPQPPSDTTTVSQRQDTVDLAVQTHNRLNNLSQSLEFRIDQFADSLHRLEQYRQCADRVAEGILSKSAEALEQRDKERMEKSGGEETGTDSIDVLRALSRVNGGSSNSSHVKGGR